MINKPSVDELSDKADSVYTIVILASQRAKQINDEQELLLDEEKYHNEKPVTRSLQELAAGKIKYDKNSIELFENVDDQKSENDDSEEGS